ncbi:MAG TPA: hypothetical protein VL173_18045 [Vicinamibacterales bacterium]|nr:hypothetical protein [Vicinamibacterales bacterium]
MRATFLFLTVFVVSLLASTAPAVAQEGFPLKGSWVGTWGPSKLHDNDLLVVLTWDGKAVSGQVNPGTDDAKIKTASLNPEGWLVHMEFDGKDKAGKVVSYVLDGKIDGLAFRNRTISGTWKGGGEMGQFKLQRQ